jgi:hypothetical protein
VSAAWKAGRHFARQNFARYAINRPTCGYSQRIWQVRCFRHENFGTGPGRDFQELSKESPAFAVEFAGVTLRNERKHYGPINTRAAKVMPDCDAMLRKVQDFVTASPGSCPLLV